MHFLIYKLPYISIEFFIDEYFFALALTKFIAIKKYKYIKS